MRVLDNTYRRWVGEHVNDIEVEGEWYLPGFEFLEPVFVEQHSVILIEGSGIREEGSTHKDIPHQSVVM